MTELIFQEGSVDQIVHIAFEAGKEYARESMCVEMGGHVESTDDQSGDEGGHVDVRCSRCGKRLE